MTDEKINEIADYLLKKDPKEFHSFYDYEDPLLAIIKYYYFIRLNWCGCGTPGEALRTVAKFLEARSGKWEERNAKTKEAFGTEKIWENELLCCMAYTMDAAGFTDHGSSIFSCWTSDEGTYFMEAIREAEKREELDF